MNDEGVLDGAAGPIPPCQAKQSKLPHWAFDPEKGEQFWRRLLEFERLTAEGVDLRTLFAGPRLPEQGEAVYPLCCYSARSICERRVVARKEVS